MNNPSRSTSSPPYNWRIWDAVEGSKIKMSDGQRVMETGTPSASVHFKNLYGKACARTCSGEQGEELAQSCHFPGKSVWAASFMSGQSRAAWVSIIRMWWWLCSVASRLRSEQYKNFGKFLLQVWYLKKRWTESKLFDMDGRVLKTKFVIAKQLEAKHVCVVYKRENQIMAAGTVYTNKELPHYKGQ